VLENCPRPSFWIRVSSYCDLSTSGQKTEVWQGRERYEKVCVNVVSVGLQVWSVDIPKKYAQERLRGLLSAPDPCAGSQGSSHGIFCKPWSCKGCCFLRGLTTTRSCQQWEIPYAHVPTLLGLSGPSP
jgi:hypothetical protein